MTTKIVRFHNIFGPYGTWDGGREKAPAALCRKIAQARMVGLDEIEIWGDGEQSRSFCYVDDWCYRCTICSEFPGLLNLGQDCSVTINELAMIIGTIVGGDFKLRHVPGLRECADGTPTIRSCEVLSWEPQITLEQA
jgi:nucleoside-diphosphate-sugar epimerase